MGVTPGKKSPRKTPKRMSAADSEPMETTVISPGKKTVTPKSPSNGSEKKSDSKKKSLKRKLGDDDYEEIKNSEAEIVEDDLNDSQKESGKKQKKKKQRVEIEEENKSSDSAKKADLSSGDDDKEDEEGKNLPSECKLFVTSIGLEGMSKQDLRDYFKGHGHCLVLNIKRIKSRHAFVGFATVKEAKKARESLDKTDCRGFPLSIDSKDLMLGSLGLIKAKPARLINTEGTADCSLYVSPMTPTVTKQRLMDSFVGVVRFHRKRKKNWVRLECINSAVAKELHRSHQGKVVEGTTLRLETVEEFRKRITDEETERTRQFQKQIQLEKKMEKKQKQQEKKQEKKSKPEPKESSDESDSEEDADDVRVVNDDGDSEEEEVPPKSKKAKVAGKR